MTSKDLEALEYLIEQARGVKMTEAESTKQRRSFAYGNSAFENPDITKEMVDEEANKIGL